MCNLSPKYLDSEEWKNKTCPDEIIGFIEIKQGECGNKEISFNQRDDYESKIAIILESPHVDEFFEEEIKIFEKEDKTRKTEKITKAKQGNCAHHLTY